MHMCVYIKCFIYTSICSSGSGKAAVRLSELQFGNTAAGVPQPALHTLASGGCMAILCDSILHVCLTANSEGEDS